MEPETTTTEATTTPEGAATSTTADTTATAAATEGQTATGGQTTEVTDGKTDGDKPQGAPETYEFTAAEGQEFDPAVIAQFSEVAKELNLPQEAAQKVLDKMAPALAARQQDAIAAARADWVAQTKADTEIGGPELAQKIALANTTFEKFGTPELRALLDQSGLGDHPEMLRWAHRVGKAISEDGFVAGRSGKESSITAKSIYSNTEMNP